MSYIYTIPKDIDVSIEEVRFFYESCYGKNIPIWDELEIIVNGDKHYNFINDTAISIFKIVIKLSYIWYWVYSKILDTDTKYNGYQYSTYIDIPSDIHENESSIYLYEHPEVYSNIEIGSSMHLWFGIIPSEFMALFLQVIHKNKNCSELPNYSILGNIVNRYDGIKIWEDTILKYDLNDYIEYEYSVFPMLVEIEKLRSIKIKWIEILDWDIIFHIRVLEDNKNISLKSIVEVFGSNDEDIWNKSVNIEVDFELKGMIVSKLWKNIDITPYKLNLLKYIKENIGSENCSWRDVLDNVYWEGNKKSDALMSLIKKVNIDLRNIHSQIQVWYVSDKYIFFKRT